MKVWGAIFNIFSAFMIMIIFMTFVNLTVIFNRDFDQARLNQAVKYATEAMFKSAIEVEDIDIDYTGLDIVSINPGNSLDIFLALMCFNYDLAVSEENKDYIEDSIANIVLTGSDGFYITQTVEDDTTPYDGVDGGEFVLKWSPKILYTLGVGNVTYALNIGKERYIAIDGTGNIEIPSNEGYPLGVTADMVLEIANKKITDNMVAEIENRNVVYKDSFDFKFFLPAVTTKAGVNPIRGAGILTLVQEAKYASNERISTISVSGFRTIERINVIAFRIVDEFDGSEVKYYCYQGQMDLSDIGSKYIIENYYRNTREAAKAGYNPHYGLLTKKTAKR